MWCEYLATWQQGVTRPPDFTTLKTRHLEIEWTGFGISGAIFQRLARNPLVSECHRSASVAAPPDGPSEYPDHCENAR